MDRVTRFRRSLSVKHVAGAVPTSRRPHESISMTLTTRTPAPTQIDAGRRHRARHPRLQLLSPTVQLAETVSVPLDPAADAPGQAARFVRLQSQQAGLNDDGADHLAAVATELFGIAGDNLLPATFGMADNETRVDLFVGFDGSGGVRLGSDSMVAVDALADQWGWELTETGLRLWACLLRTSTTDTDPSPSDLPPAA
jgi:hypothetical protein